MISIKPAQQAPRALPSFAPRPCGVPASTATGDFAALMRAAGQGSPPVRSTGSVGQAEWLAQASRRPDIEAALSQLHLARRVPSSSMSRTGRCPPKTSTNVPEPTDCNAAECSSHGGPEEIARPGTRARALDLCDKQHNDPLVRHHDPCGRDVVYGAPVACLSAVAAPPTVWPLLGGTWPFYPLVSHSLQAPRVRSRRRRFLHPAADEPERESDGDGDQERG